jgi:prepilin-type N-terminal cleavage/methylation domain-containing protein
MKITSTSKGFSLIELVVVFIIIGILSYLSYFLILKYREAAANAQLISDLRHCIEAIAIYSQNYGEDLNETIREHCVKSPYTEDIVLVSTNPIVLKAVSKVSNMTCSYNATNGKIICSNPLAIINQ